MTTSPYWAMTRPRRTQHSPGLAGANANGVLSAELTASYAPDAPVKAFAAAYLKEFHIATTPFAELSYDAVFMLAKAINAGHSTSPKSIQTQLNSIRNYPGLTGNLSFTPQVHVTIQAAQLTLGQVQHRFALLGSRGLLTVSAVCIMALDGLLGAGRPSGASVARSALVRATALGLGA